MFSCSNSCQELSGHSTTKSSIHYLNTLYFQVDPCHEEKKVGPCKAAIPRQASINVNHAAIFCLCFSFCLLQIVLHLVTPFSILRFFFDGASGSCSSFTYGGCRGNGNNFASQQECEAKCISSRRWDGFNVHDDFYHYHDDMILIMYENNWS